jgi:hypothetical protein
MQQRDKHVRHVLPSSFPSQNRLMLRISEGTCSERTIMMTRMFALWQLALVFSMQGVGRLFCAVVLLLCLYIPNTDAQWRVAILMGKHTLTVWLPYPCSDRVND